MTFVSKVSCSIVFCVSSTDYLAAFVASASNAKGQLSYSSSEDDLGEGNFFGGRFFGGRWDFVVKDGYWTIGLLPIPFYPLLFGHL